MNKKEQLKKLILDKAIEFGKFKLSSDKISEYYLDCRKVTLDSIGANLIGEIFFEELFMDSLSPLPDAVGGMTLGADPIISSIITTAGQKNVQLAGFIIRKEIKDHGMLQIIEGPVEPEMDVIIVEDVITTGKSVLQAIEKAEDFGLNVKKVIAIVDRLEGGTELLEQKGYKLNSIFNIRDFI